MSKPIQVGDASSLESLDMAYKVSQERHHRERLLAICLAHQRDTRGDWFHTEAWARYHCWLGESIWGRWCREAIAPWSWWSQSQLSQWDQVKRHVANDIWETLDGIESSINEVLEPFWEHVTRAWSLLGNTWLTRGVIIFLQHRLE